ncbi:amino acid kinase family protein [Aureliella helgolandensis]|uniref:Amino acid kinase family protein n=1 Tax=Aureliella helgolandensis TaxID=2527968 RepID=A0A518G7B3_9BACT|nr:hypothetical protein [Aureliella helgolandensis]QDV24477.1 Amino acid kinase family protein [Aureliella helgolandensis]
MHKQGSPRPIRIVKLGGSLLNTPDLRSRFDRWCAANPHPCTLVLVGGGSLVDAVRQLDAVHQFSATFSHWLCISLLEQTARLAHQLLPNRLLIETREDLDFFLSSRCATDRRSQQSVAIVQVGLFIHPTQGEIQLPESWDITSDSIAAACCQRMNAEKLVLLKSVTVTRPMDRLDELAQQGIVDPYFPDLAKSLHQVEIVNLRE